MTKSMVPADAEGLAEASSFDDWAAATRHRRLRNASPHRERPLRFCRKIRPTIRPQWTPWVRGTEVEHSKSSESLVEDGTKSIMSRLANGRDKAKAKPRGCGSSFLSKSPQRARQQLRPPYRSAATAAPPHPRQCGTLRRGSLSNCRNGSSAGSERTNERPERKPSCG
jgi:hypothetical protein